VMCRCKRLTDRTATSRRDVTCVRRMFRLLLFQGGVGSRVPVLYLLALVETVSKFAVADFVL